jgi:hypothetical protein
VRYELRREDNAGRGKADCLNEEAPAAGIPSEKQSFTLRGGDAAESDESEDGAAIGLHIGL